MSRRRGDDDRGSVVAEFAVALPAVVLVVMLGVGALAAGAKHVRLQDALADAARLASRGEPDERVRAVVTRGVGGASVQVETTGDLVCVTGDAPGFLLIRIDATSCALAGGL